MEYFFEPQRRGAPVGPRGSEFTAPTGRTSNGTYRTRGAEKVLIYNVARSGAFPIHGAIFCRKKLEWVSTAWTLQGRASRLRKTNRDLFNDWRFYSLLDWNRYMTKRFPHPSAEELTGSPTLTGPFYAAGVKSGSIR